MKTLQTLFRDEWADTYDAEQRIARALPKMARAATCTRLQAALELLGYEEAAQLLHENLEQEKGADAALSKLARSGNSEEARAAAGANRKISKKSHGRLIGRCLPSGRSR